MRRAAPAALAGVHLQERREEREEPSPPGISTPQHRPPQHHPHRTTPPDRGQPAAPGAQARSPHSPASSSTQICLRRSRSIPGSREHCSRTRLRANVLWNSAHCICATAPAVSPSLSADSTVQSTPGARLTSILYQDFNPAVARHPGSFQMTHGALLCSSRSALGTCTL